MAGDTSLGYVVADKFSMDPKKRQQIFAKCKKDDDNLEKRKKEILENMLTNKTNQDLEKIILKDRRIIKEKQRILEKIINTNQILKDEGAKNDN